MRYIGETRRWLIYRLANHRGYDQDFDKVTGAHFNLPGHALSNMKITILGQVKSLMINTENREKNI